MVVGAARAREEFLERDAEQRALEDLIAATAAGEGRLVVLEGEAGIGKTSLLELAVGVARERGLVAFEACGSALEQRFAFGVVRQLFERRLHAADAERRRDLLAGAASFAMPILGLSGPVGADGSPADGVYAAQHGLYWLAANLAARAPALIAVDDVQWADEASLRWLHYLARRLDGARIAVLVARRLGVGALQEGLLDELQAVPGAEVIAPAPLSEEAAAVLGRGILSAEPDARFTRACHEMTGGNPFLLHELLRTLAEERVVPEAAAETRVRRLGPTAVMDEVKRQFHRLTPATGELAWAVAVLDVDADLRHVAALAGLDLAAAGSAADELVLARILVPGRPLRFRHPILRAAVYHDIPPVRRNRAHRKAAELLDEVSGAVDRAAAHLTAVEPMGDAWVVERLQAGAERAMGRAAPDAAITLLERARREPDEGPELALALGRAMRLAGRYADADEYLRQALERLPAGEPREHVTRELAVVRMARWHGREAVAVLDAALAQTPRDARERRLRLEADRAWIGLASDEIRRETAARLESLAGSLTGSSPAERVLLGALATLRAYEARGSAAEVAALAERALGDGRLLHEQTPEMFTFGWTAQVLLLCDRDELARRHLEAGLAEARASGAGPTAGVLLLALGRVALHRGEVAEAEAAASAAGELVTHRYARHSSCALLVAALLERGAFKEAERALAEAELDRGALPPLGVGQTLLVARVALRVAQGRLGEAAADADDLLERLVQKGHGGLRERPTAILALLAAGAGERARELPEQELAVALRWGAPSAVGGAQRVLGLALGGEQGLDRLWQATATLAQTPCRLELAKALINLGGALRRTKRRREARTPLRQALELAYHCGADILVHIAREELRACGARPRRLVLSGVESLTPSERRVARLVAKGLSNPEVAQTLFVTRRTVETHLSAVYRKLAITTRDELAAVLNEPEGQLPDATLTTAGPPPPTTAPGFQRSTTPKATSKP